MVTDRLSISKLIFMLPFIILVFLIHDGNIAFGGPLDIIRPKPSGGGSTVTRSDLDQVYFFVSEADKLLKKSVDIVFLMTANKEKRQEIQMQEKAVENLTDPKEKDSKINEIYKTKVATIEHSIQSEEASSKIAYLSAEQRQFFGYATWNIILAGLRDLEAVGKVRQLVSIIQSNPTYAISFAADLDKLQYIVTTLPSQAVRIQNLGSNLAKMANANKIEVAFPKSAAEKPKEVDLEVALSSETKGETMLSKFPTEKPKRAVDSADRQSSQPTTEAKLSKSSVEKPKEIDLQNNESSTATEKITPGKSSSERPREIDLKERQPSQVTKMVSVAWTFVIVRSNPGTEFPVVTHVEKGDKLLITGEKGEWLNVKLENGKQGWVNKTFVK